MLPKRKDADGGLEDRGILTKVNTVLTVLRRKWEFPQGKFPSLHNELLY